MNDELGTIVVITYMACIGNYRGDIKCIRVIEHDGNSIDGCGNPLRNYYYCS